MVSIVFVIGERVFGMSANEESLRVILQLLDASNGISRMIMTNEADRERAAYASARRLTVDRFMAAVPEFTAFVFGMEAAHRKLVEETTQHCDALRDRVEALESQVGARDDS